MQVLTVLGPIAPERLGVTLPHEHLIVDHFKLGRGYDAIMDDEELAIEELNVFKKAGGSALVDVTNLGIGRNPLALKRISEATGVHIIMGSGWYREAVYPAYIYHKSVDELADIFVRDITEGTEGTGVRAGVIGEIGTERGQVSPAEERVFRAAARAHRRTNAPITTHTTHFGELALEQLAILRSEGVDPRRVIIGHVGEQRGVNDLLPIAETGAFLQIDHIGFPEYQPERQRAKNVALLVKEGLLPQVLISHDVCLNSHLHWYGGHGYDHILVKFVPMLREAGLTEEEIHAILVENPRRALAFQPVSA